MSTLARYETRPLECYSKGKELRESYYKRLYQAKQEGKAICAGIANRSSVLPASLEGCEPMECSSHLLTIGSNRQVAAACAEALEARGYQGDFCAGMRVFLGAMYLNLSPWGEFLKPDLVLQVQYCEPLAKTAQILSEEMSIPYFCLDLPVIVKENRQDFHTRYFVDQMQEAIEWMERVTGKRFSDEALIEGVKNEWLCLELWAKICELNKAIPAPLDQRTLFSLSAPVNLMRHRAEAVAFYREVYDEMQWRVQNRIAAVATERFRLLHEGLQVLYFNQVMRYPEKYGAVFIGSHFDLALGSAFERQEDASWQVMPGLEERGLAMRTREDALNAVADYFLINPTFNGFALSWRAEEVVKVAQDWHAQGVVFHMDRGCQGLTAGAAETRLLLQKEGIPSMVYEASYADPRGFAEVQVLDRLDAFLESMGLKPIA